MAQDKTMKRLLVWLLLILSVLLIIPPLHYHYVYPNMGDDTASHLIYFQNMDMGGVAPLYYGQYLVGKLVNILPFDIKVSFLWFHYAVMIMALWAIGLTVGIAVNWLAGILSVFGVFGISYLVSLFYWGQIFDIVGISILLTIVLLCLHKMDRGIGWKIGAIISIVAFTLFHANGKYIIALVPIAILYEVGRVIVTRKHKEIGLKMRGSRYLVYVGSLSVILWALSRMGYSPDAGRLWMDGSILMAICIWGVAGLYLSKKNVLVSVGIIVVVIGLAIPNLILTLQNNSAVKDADKEAFAYLNSLSGQTYSVDANVSQDIYGLFVKKQFYETVGADYVVARTIPMTPRSDPDSVFYDNADRSTGTSYLASYGYKILRIFDDGEKDRISGLPIIVEVYGK